MTEKMQKNVTIFFYSLPFLDMITAIMLHIFNVNITLGMFARSLFLLFGVFYIYFFHHQQDCKKRKIILTIVLLYCFCFLLHLSFHQNTNTLLFEITNLTKTMFFQISLLSCYTLFQDGYQLPKNYFFKLYLIYLLGIFIPNLFNIGFKTYEVTKKGHIGFFHSANEIGAILSILLPFYSASLLKETDKKKTFIGLAILLYVLLTIGTKTPLLAFFITLFVFGIYYLTVFIKQKKYKQLLAMLFVIIIFMFTMIQAIPKTTFYQNIKTHLQFLHVKNVSDIFQNEELFDHFIFSSRLKFFKTTATHYHQASWQDKLLGIGYVDQAKDIASVKMIEMDYADIFFRHGIIGALLYYLIYLYFLIKAATTASHLPTEEKLTTYLSYSLIIVLAGITGHILLAPSVSLLVCLLLLKKGETYEKTTPCHDHH